MTATFHGHSCYHTVMTRAFLAAGLCLLLCAAASAQPNPRAQLESRFEASGLSPGKPFPAVDIHDAAGKPFNTSSLEGSYAVVVSGCLT